MEDRSFFVDNLIEKAKKKNNDKIIEKLNNPKFLNSFYEVCEIFENLDLEVKDKMGESFDYQMDINLKLSRTLANNYFTIYYVNLLTGKYIGYSSSDDYHKLKIEENGSDFFYDTQINAQKVIYKPDIEKVLNAITKENIINNTKDGKTFNLVYRLLMNNEPTYVSLKAIKIANEDNNVIIGISHIDDKHYKKALEENLTYYNIALSLVQNYFDLFYVDINTSEYIEYTINSKTQELDKVSCGKDFFKDTITNAKKLVFHADQPKFLDVLKRENLLEEIKNGKSFTLTYRLVIDTVPTHCQLTAINLINDANHIILAVRNIDAQMKKDDEYRENLEFERRMARTDGLTGANNKYSYLEDEKHVNELIREGKDYDFSVVLCDINDLKIINDTYGHDAGDSIIREAANLLASTFKNSTIYRIGGDEFVLILDGSDYYKREILVNNIKKYNEKKTSGLILACGYADYDKNNDTALIDVFKRADNKMYENKKYLKER